MHKSVIPLFLFWGLGLQGCAAVADGQRETAQDATASTAAKTAASASTAHSPAHDADRVLLQTTANRAIRQGYADTADGQLHYWTAGEADGEVLFLIHQSGAASEEYAAMVPWLANRYRLVSFDWPGHGSSDDPSQEYLVEDYARSALAVLDHLKIGSAHVLGNHGGALVAMHLAWQHPNRINRLILSGTSGVKEQTESDDFVESLDLRQRNRVELDGTSISQTWERYKGYMPDSIAGTVLVPYSINIRNRLRPYEAHYGVLRYDRRPALAAIKNKTILLTQGDRDSYVSHQETLLQVLPNAQRAVVEGGGTFMFYEKPKQNAELIDQFLSSKR